VRAVVFPSVHHFEVAEVAEPEVRAGWLTLEVGTAGICGTDLHILEGEFPMAKFPCIPGHEFAGTVIGVGPEVAGFRAGDRVGVMPSVFCGACHWCRNGRGNLCPDAGGFGTSLPGGFAERVAVLATHAYRLPDGLSFAEAALVEPLACVVHAFHRLNPRAGESYLIWGAGTMGLMLAQYARFAGARTVALVDVNRAKLDRAGSFGFQVLGESYADVRDRGPFGFDNVIEATGVPAVVESASESVTPGGRLLLFGVCPPGARASLEPYRIYRDEIDVIGSMAVFESYEPALAAMASGAIDGRRMVSHTFDLVRFGEALDVVRSGAGMKVQIVPAS
jgi:2-desacetyl-2-hydroxyethyl bacteriochlorophyllide A dehydrogenase